MARYMRITLTSRDVSFTARLLDDEAPLTCAAVWDALPLEGDAGHAKYASNEFYTLVPPLSEELIGLENGTITPIAGDVCYFEFGMQEVRQDLRQNPAYADLSHLVDLAIFYARNNLLLSPVAGYTPGNVFAAIEDDLDQLAATGNDVWRSGFADEKLVFSRA